MLNNVKHFVKLANTRKFVTSTELGLMDVSLVVADVLPSHDLLLYVVHSVVGVEPDHDTRPVTQPYLHMTGNNARLA